MRTEANLCLATFAIVLAGIAVSAAASVVPHYTAGFQLDVGVLAVGLLPYIVYATLAEVVRGRAALIAGALILALDIAVKIPGRFLHYDGYADGWVYWAPLISTFVILPVVFGVATRGGGRVETPDVKTQTEKTSPG
jgi:hypothetical protein